MSLSATPSGEAPTEISIQISGGEIIHNGPHATKQNYKGYSARDHETWSLLFSRQIKTLEDIAYTPWLEALGETGLRPDRCPSFTELSQNLQTRTGWTVVGVDQELQGHHYFWYLSNKLFPAIPRIRSRAKLDFSNEPDLFHDAFGHAPMHSCQTFSRLLEIFAKAALQLREKPSRLAEIERLYWFSVECGLIHEDHRIKVCGSTHFSSSSESRFALSDNVQKLAFDAKKITHQTYDPYALQTTLFVLDSHEQVLDAMLAKVEEFGIEINQETSPSNEATQA